MTAAVNSPNDKQIGIMLQLAWKQHQAGQLQAAEDAYLKILTASPGDPDTNNLIGLLYIQTRRPRTLNCTSVKRWRLKRAIRKACTTWALPAKTSVSGMRRRRHSGNAWRWRLAAL